MRADAVILCTGGYGANNDMVKYYGLLDEMGGCHVGPITNDGVGQRMAEGVNCGIRGVPRWPAVASEGGIDAVGLGRAWTWEHTNEVTRKNFPDRQLSGYTYAPIQLGRQAVLKVNRYGKRYVNEETIGITNQDYGMCEYLVTPDCYVYFNDNDIRPMWDWQDEMQDGIDKGFIVTADTLEELADKLEINKDNFLATVDRWNEICDAGEDPDYDNYEENLRPVRTAPFYGMKRRSCFVWQAAAAEVATVATTQVATAEPEKVSESDSAAHDVFTSHGCTTCHNEPSPQNFSPLTNDEIDTFLSGYAGLTVGGTDAVTIENYVNGQ